MSLFTQRVPLEILRHRNIAVGKGIARVGVFIKPVQPDLPARALGIG